MSERSLGGPGVPQPDTFSGPSDRAGRRLVLDLVLISVVGDHIQPAAAEHKYLFDMLQQTILTKDGQEGLKAFREKRPAEWVGE